MPSGALAKGRSILLVIDVGDDKGSTIREIELFKEQYPAAHVAVLADRNQLNDSNIVAAFRAGANAYFAKGTTSNPFIKSLELVILGETILPSAILSLLDHRDIPVASEIDQHPAAEAAEGGRANAAP